MKKLVNYCKESYNELVHKVSWPSWEDLQSSAIVVSVAALLIALVVFVMDFVFGIQQGTGVWKGLLGFFYGV